MPVLQYSNPILIGNDQDFYFELKARLKRVFEHIGENPHASQ